MKNDVIADQLAKLIIKNERDRLDKIMEKVMKQVSNDFAAEMMRYADMYYDNYDPTSYVRVYGKRGKYMSGQKPKPGQVSLHAAMYRSDGSLDYFDTPLHSNGYVSYVGGIEFDKSNFNRNKMKHTGKGYSKEKGNITEWDIVQNFLYAGDAEEHKLTGDWRSDSRSGYDAPSPHELMMKYMDDYFDRFKQHCENISDNFK